MIWNTDLIPIFTLQFLCTSSLQYLLISSLFLEVQLSSNSIKYPLFITPTVSMVLHSSICEWRVQRKAIVGHIHELPDGFLRRVGCRLVMTLRILNGEGPFNESMNGWSIGVRIYPDGSKTRWSNRRAKVSTKTFLDEKSPISCPLLRCSSR